jgi:outer membrane lipase/esterase
MNHTRPIVGFGLALLLTAASLLAQNRTYTNQYTFGDSLSDNGNAYVASGGTVNASAPYFGGRWSNGPTWAELLGNTLAIGAAAPASVKSSMDFAFGGATAVPALSAVPFPALSAQIAMFQSHAVSVQRTDLFTVWMGANDILNTAGLKDPSIMAGAGINAAQAAGAGIQTLIGLGAKNILVFNMPDIGLSPAGLASGGSSLLTPGSLAYNNEFDARLRSIAAAAPDVTITRVDAAGLIAQMQRDYQKLGFTTASSGLILPASQGGGGDPNGYVFFDGIHPTARTHAMIARVVAEVLNPEPVVGFAATQGTAALALQGLAASSYETRISQMASANRAIGRADAYASFNFGGGDRAADGWRHKFVYDAQATTVGVDARVSDGVFWAAPWIPVGCMRR